MWRKEDEERIRDRARKAWQAILKSLTLQAMKRH